MSQCPLQGAKGTGRGRCLEVALDGKGEEEITLNYQGQVSAALLLGYTRSPSLKQTNWPFLCKFAGALLF